MRNEEQKQLQGRCFSQTRRYERQSDKLLGNDLFTVAKMSRPAIIFRGKEMERYLPETFQWSRNISILVVHMIIQTSIVVVRQKLIQKIHIETIQEVIRAMSRT